MLARAEDRNTILAGVAEKWLFEADNIPQDVAWPFDTTAWCTRNQK